VTEWPAFLYDGKTAERQPVTLTLNARGIQVRNADGTGSGWPIADIRQTAGSFSSEQLKLEIGTDPVMALVINAPGFVEAMRATFPESQNKVRGQAQTTRFALWGVAVLIAAAALYVAAAPFVANWTAERVPREWEAALGSRVAKEMAPEKKQCTDPGALEPTRAIMTRLTTAAASPYTFSMVILDDSMVNAFAAPGGFVVVTTGLLRAAETPEQFAGVLAHEIQHVTHRHTTRGILREMPVRLALGALFGGTGVENIADAATTLGALGYRRGDETEADVEGLKLLQKAGVDTKGMVEFMGILEKQPGAASSIPKYLSSHPKSADRAATLGALAAQDTRPTTPLLDAAQWKRVRASCGR
jgi:predicted Zn-dependent protease